MFFMIAVMPYQKVLRHMFLSISPEQKVQSAEILETGSRLILFFIPVWTFHKRLIVQFSNGTQAEIQGLSKQEILDANRNTIEAHLSVIHEALQPEVCSNCGYPMQPDFNVCPRCGKPRSNFPD